MIEELEKSMIENYVNSYKRFDLEGMLKDLSDHVIFENFCNGIVDRRTEGIDAFKKGLDGHLFEISRI